MNSTTTRKHTPQTRLLCLILALMTAMLMTGAVMPALRPVKASAITNFNLWICGTRVTTSNESDILGSSSKVKFKFDHNNNELYVSGSGSVYTSISSTNESVPVISSTMSNLTIIVSNNISFYDSKNVPLIISSKAFSIEGSGKLQLSGHAACIAAPKVNITNTSLDMSGNIGITAYSQEWDNLVKSVTINNSSVTGSFSSCFIERSEFNYPVSLNDCRITDPSLGSFSYTTVVGHFSNITSTQNLYEIFVQNFYGTRMNDFKITPNPVVTTTAPPTTTKPGTTAPPSSTYTGIKINGEAVTSDNKGDILNDGVFSYDPDNKTLYIKKDYYASNYPSYHGAVIENTGIDGLIIYSDDGTNAVSIANLEPDDAAPIRLSKDTTFAGKALWIDAPNECGIRITGSPTVTFNSPINIRSYRNTSANYGIWGTTSSKLVFNAGDSNIYDIETAAVYGVGSVSVGSSVDILPHPWYCYNGIRDGSNSSAPYAKLLSIVTVKKYDLWIGGTQVTNINEYDILGNGMFKYEPGSSGGENKLRINTSNKTYTGDIKSKIDNLTVIADGHSTINGNFEIYGTTRFYWASSCTLTTNRITSYNGKSLTLSNCHVFVGDKNAATPSASHYILAKGQGSITIGGEVFAESYIASESGFITLDNSYIKAPRGGAVAQSGSYKNAVSFNGKLSDMVHIVHGTKPVEFFSNSMTLGGSLGLNFFADLSVLPTNSLSGIYTEFTLFNQSNKQRADLDLNSMNSSKTGYRFSCKINAVSMADPVSATLYYTLNGTSRTARTSATAESYLKKFGPEDGDKIWNLIKGINDYGYYMQPYLAVNASKPWTLGVDHKKMEKAYTVPSVYKANKSTYLSELSSKKKSISLVEKDIEKVNYSLNLDSDTTLNFKIKPTSSYKGTPVVTLGSTKLTVKKLSDGRFQVSIPNIPAHQLGDMKTLSIKTTNGTSTVKASALSYAYECINAPLSDDEFNAFCALYEYYKASVAYKQK